MRARLATFWRRRAASVIAGLAIWMAAAATTPATPPVDTAMAERAVSGAEWLAGRASENPAAEANTSGAGGLVEWLLKWGLADEETYAAFSGRLESLGYDRELATYLFLEELPRVLLAHEAAATADSLDLEQIRAEIAASPTIPLDERGEQRIRELFYQRGLASVPDEVRAVVAPFGDRIERLLATASKGGDQ
jgi:hypothetical protein